MADYTGRLLGNYRLRQLLGRGGFGEVYLGEHIHLGTFAAIKVLPILTANNELDDFRHEARLIAHLSHPHIVRVLDFGVEDSTPFLVMDYAPNGTLRQRYPRGTRLPLATIIPYVQQVAQALQYAHDRKVIHRDVKPENLLLDGNDQVLLSDFGISAVERSTSRAMLQKKDDSSQTGTPIYMAPEQIQGASQPASDQYALAVVVYEWLCGSRPFSGAALSVMYQHVHVPPPTLREKLPTVSPAVEQVIRRTLAKDPRQRFATIQDFARALEEASQVEEAPTLLALPYSTLKPVPTVEPVREPQPPPAAKPVPTVEPVREPQPPPAAKPIQTAEPVHRRKAPFMIRVVLPIGLILILVVAGLAFFLSFSSKHGKTTPATNVRATSTAQAHATATASLRATATVAINEYNTATASGVMLGFDAQHTHVNPYEKIITASNVVQLMQAWKASSGNGIGSVPTIANGMVYVSSSDGKMYAFDAATGVVRWTAPIGSYDFGCAPLVANGVVYMGAPDNNFYALDAKTGHVLWTAPTRGRIGSSPVLENGVIYIGSDDGALYAFSVSTSKQLWSVQTGGSIRSSPAVANGVVYVGSDDGYLYAINAAHGNTLWTYHTKGKVRSSPAVVKGVIYVGSDDHTLYALNATTGVYLWSVTTAGGIESSPAVSNGVIYIGSEDDKLYAIDAAHGNTLWSAPTQDSIFSSASIANGVLYIGSNDHKLYAFNASGCGSTSCSPLWTAATRNAIQSSPAVANGFIYVGSNDGNLYAFDLPRA